jgi:hypothetical protein
MVLAWGKQNCSWLNNFWLFNFILGILFLFGWGRRYLQALFHPAHGGEIILGHRLVVCAGLNQVGVELLILASSPNRILLYKIRTIQLIGTGTPMLDGIRSILMIRQGMMLIGV